MRRHFPEILWLSTFVLSLGNGVSLRAADVDDKLLAVLGSKASPGEKAAACNELQRIGTVRCVPQLAELLTDPQLAHPARSALETLPFPEAGKALRDAVGKTTGVLRMGVIASIGARRDAAAVDLLVGLLKEKDEQVIAAATRALGDIGTQEAGDHLGKAFFGIGTSAGYQLALGDGCLRCARQLAKDGKTAAAVALYQQLFRDCIPPHVTRGALQGLLDLAGPGKLKLLREFLVTETKIDARAIAAGHINELSKQELQELVKDMAQLPEKAQVAVLAALTVRDDSSFGETAIKAAQKGSDRVRVAALKTLGRLGDASALPLLTEALFAGEKTHDAARQSLELLAGEGVDKELVRRMQTETVPARRGELIDILAERGAVAAVAALVQEMRGDSAEVRSRAMIALGRLASAKDLPEMLPGLLKTVPGPERDQVEQAILAVSQQIPQAEKRADPILAGMARMSEEEKANLLPLLGRTGTPAALDMIRTALTSKNPKLFTEGLKALANWPSPAVAEQLLTLAQQSTSPENRGLALAGVARAATAPGELAPDRRLALLQQAMKLATQDDQRKLILERAALVKTIETLRFVVPYLDQAPLADQACRTVVELAHSRTLRQPHLKEFTAALEKVIRTSHEAGIVDRAKKYLAGL